jgi:hypothetical protein
MNSSPAWPPTDWAYPEYSANIDAAPERTVRPLPVMVYDHSADEPVPISWRVIALNCGVGALIGVVLVAVLFGWLPW